MSLLFSGAEHAQRVDAVRERCEAAELDTLLAVGRGGGPIDRYGNVFYLTEAYSGFPTIPDHPGEWTDRGWSAALVTDSDVVVVGDPDTAVLGAVYADSVVTGLHFTDLLIDTLRVASRKGNRIGLAGADTLTWRQTRAISAALPDDTLIDADDLVMGVRVVKSPAEILAMRASGEVALAAMTATMKAAQNGASEADAAAAAAEEVARAGASMANAFTGLGPGRAGLVHSHVQSPPYAADSIIRTGDIFTVDISGALHGYFFDVARSKVVDAEPTPEQDRVMQLVIDMVDAVADVLKPGATIGDATRVGLAVLESAGYDIKSDHHWQALGHGLGMAFEPPYLFENSTEVVRAGMVISVERHCTIGSASATYERNLVIDDDGATDLVPIPASW